MNDVATVDPSEIMEQVLLKGDLAKLTPEQRNSYYMQTCQSLGLNPLTRPFDYIVLNGKMTLYARRDAADQLRKINGVNIEIVDKRVDAGMFIVTVRAQDKSGRQDEDMGIVALPNGAGEVRANAMLKAITKAKRRVTLSICGLGFLDETEVEDIRPHPSRPQAQVIRSPTSESQADQGEQSPAPTPQPQSAGDMPLEEFTESEMLADDGLAAAADQGMGALQAAWKDLHPSFHERLRPRLDSVHKPAARKAGK